MIKTWRKLIGGGSATPQVDLSAPVDLTAAAFIADPYPVYAALRADQPLAEVTTGGFLLTRHADVMAALENPDLGNQPSRFSVLAARNRDRHVVADVAANIPPFLDPPQHGPVRLPLARAVFDTLRAQQDQIAALAQAMVAAIPPGPVEVISQVSSPFACRTAAAFVGCDLTPDQVKHATSAFFHLFAPATSREAIESANTALAEARALLLGAVVSARQPDATPSLIAFLVRADGAPLSDLQIADLALLILADAVENIEAGAALILNLILQTPEARSAVAAGTTEAVIREALRLDSPAQSIPRVARVDTTILGREIKQGTPVHLSLASANRDETVHDQAHLFRLGRSTGALTFGASRHRCLGEALTQAQLGALLTALLTRGVSQADWSAPLQYHARFGHRWPVSLSSVLH